MRVTNRRLKIPAFQCPACDSTLTVDRCAMTDDGEWLIAEQPVIIAVRKVDDTLRFLIEANQRLRDRVNAHAKAQYERNTRPRPWWKR